MLDKISDRDFQKLTRSTVPLMTYWKDQARALAALGLDLAGATVEPEYATPVRGPGRGKPSMTDIMVRTPALAVAVEGKWTEARYADVARWRGVSRNRNHVLAYWLGIIRQRAEVPIDANFDGLVYQMVHRTASACAAGTHAVVVYQVFGDGRHRANYVADLGAVAAAVRPKATLGMWVMNVPIGTTAAYDEIGWQVRGLRAAAAAAVIRAAVRDRALFEFGEPTFVSVCG